VANITNKEIEAAVKSGYDRARQAMEKREWGLYLSLKKQWEFAFGDVGDIICDDDDDDDEKGEKSKANRVPKKWRTESTIWCRRWKVELNDAIETL